MTKVFHRTFSVEVAVRSSSNWDQMASFEEEYSISHHWQYFISAAVQFFGRTFATNIFS